eukprot:Nitzschia sp. Nitz4//scaffold132_size63325//19881//20705//NITZ4_006290-RA/size63325-processed-gene-0.16-mRNA-1//1//CDS//3329535314//1689//frame0
MLKKDFPNSTYVAKECLGSSEQQQGIMSWNDIHSGSIFGSIFRLFFQPSPQVEAIVNDERRRLGLISQKYNVVHCRVRHPKAADMGMMFSSKKEKTNPDQEGLLSEGDGRQFAINMVSKAIECSKAIEDKLPGTNQHTVLAPTPIYFMSDSNDLVRHVTVELQDSKFVESSHSDVDQRLYDIVKPVLSNSWVKARNVSKETMHIDRQKDRPLEAYYETFVDMLLAIEANCIVYGVGKYAVFAAKVAGTGCQYLYQNEAWGGVEKAAMPCPINIM